MDSHYSHDRDFSFEKFEFADSKELAKIDTENFEWIDSQHTVILQLVTWYRFLRKSIDNRRRSDDKENINFECCNHVCNERDFIMQWTQQFFLNHSHVPHVEIADCYDD